MTALAHCVFTLNHDEYCISALFASSCNGCRHWRFWQQLDSVDLARSWSAVNAKVLSLFGGTDYIACSELEHQLIERTVNAAHPGNATFLRIPDVDHLISQNPDWKSSQKHIGDIAYRNTHFHQGLADSTVKWMRNVMAGN